MRLTLRTLLAWLDDTLPPVQVREIGKQVADSPLAQELVQRIHRVTRQRRLTIPSKNGPDATDPNLVASYLDNDLEPEKVGEYEKKCLTSDVNLAEAASVHQILSLLGQKVQVPADAKARMYHLVKGREARPATPPDGATAVPETLTKPIPPWVVGPTPRRRSLERFGPPLVVLGLIGLLSWSAYESLKPGTNAPLPLDAVQIRQSPALGTADQDDAREIAAPAAVENPADTPEPPKVAASPTPADVDTNTDKTNPALHIFGEPKGETAKNREIPQGAVGVAAKIDGMLLRYDVDKREWERLAEGAALNASDRLLVLDPFRAVVATGKSTIDLLGNTEIQLLQKNAADEPVIGLLHGRVVVEPSSSPAVVHCVFTGRTIDLEQPADAAVGLQLMNGWVFGRPMPEAGVLGVHASQGEIPLSMDKAKETLTGPGTILATSSGRFDRLNDAKPPSWAIEPDRSPETADLRARFLKEFSVDRPVLADLVSATESQSAEIKSLAISGLRALGDLSLLTPILDRPSDPVARQAAIAAIRDQLALGGAAEQRTWDQLVDDFGPDVGATLQKLLAGFSDEEAADDAIFKKLVNDVSLRQPSLGIRELAFDSLKRLTGRTTIAYDADHPEPGYAAWNRLLEAGNLKLEPKDNPPK